MNSKKKNVIEKFKDKISSIKVNLAQKKALKKSKPKVSLGVRIKQRINKVKSYSFSDVINYIFHSKKFKTNTLSLLVIAIFIVTTVNVLTLILNFIGGHQSTRYYIEDNIKYLEIDNGYITEKLIVESGDLLPDIKDYFNESYEINEDATISYYSGKNGITIENFTYEKDGNLYVRGVQEIDVIINNGKEYTTKLVIRDTTEPFVTLQDLTITEGESLDPNSFVSIYNDNSQITEYEAYFPESINFSSAGVYDIKIKVCDYSNNCVEGISKLTVNKGNSENISVGNNNKNETSSSSGGSKPSGSSGNKNNNSSSSSGSSGSSGNNSGSSSGGSSKPDDTTPPRVFVKQITKKNSIYKYDDHYGARLNYYASTVTYNLYSDGYLETVNFSGNTYTEFDPSGYVGNFKKLKQEATTYMSTNKDAINNATNLFLQETNKVRSSVGAGNLTINADLNKMALMRAMEIAYSQVITSSDGKHIRPDGRRFDTMFTDYGYSSKVRGENVAYSSSTTTNYNAFLSLKNSSGHYQNMIKKDYKKIGIGKFTFYGKTYWVQLFSD